MHWRLLKILRPSSSFGRASQLKFLVAALSIFLMVNVWTIHFRDHGMEANSYFELNQKRRNKTEPNGFACSADDTQVFDREKMIIVGKPFKEKVFLTVGIPTIERTYQNKTASYVEKMLGSLIKNLDPQDRDTFRFIVFLSDQSKRSRERIKLKLKKRFHDNLEQGLVQIIEAPSSFYPQLVGLKRTLGDKQERMYWRSKQTMDYVFLFKYAEVLSEYYLQMEDDVLSVANYSGAIKQFIQEKKSVPWVILEFSGWGFIGKLFRNSSLSHIARFLKLFYNDMPCDWLLWRYLRIMGQPQNTLRLPELFSHIGDQSSSLGT